MSRLKQVTRFSRLLQNVGCSQQTLVQVRPASCLARKKKHSELTVRPASKSQLVNYAQYSSVAWQPECKLAAETVYLDADSKTCQVTWEDGFQSKFHASWLRHNCHCKECRHPNGQKILEPADVSSSVLIESVSIKGDSLLVTWSNSHGVHRGNVPISFLRAHNYNRETMVDRRLRVKCKNPTDIPTVSYQDITTNKEWHLKWLQQINEDGISLIQGVPLEHNMVFKVAEMIGPVMPTIYGETFDVEVTPDPINVAYSSLGITLHQDLVYFESPPGLQLLHCVQFDDCVEGGGNFFLDAFDVADRFRVTYPELFHTLTTVPATFEKVHYDRDLPVHLTNQKPHIRLNHYGDVVAVYWAPPFEGALNVDAEDVEKYFLAYEMFAKMIKESTMLRHKLQPGELVVFNNLRTLHGRETFVTNGGARKFQGCYVNIDMFKSHSQVLNNLVGDGRLSKRVGNQCYF